MGNITHIYANGCSNSCAIDPETPGQPTVRTNDVYPGILAKKLNIPTYTNEALGGGSNDRIIRTTLEWVSNYLGRGHDPERLFVIIGWTQCYRKEFTWNKVEELKENTFLKEFYPFNRFWPGAMETDESEYFVGKCKDFWRLWLAHGVNDFFEQEQWLLKVIGLQSFFKTQSIKHLFINTAGFFTFKELLPLAELIDQVYYYNMFDPDLETAHLRSNKVLFGKEFETQFKIGWNGHFSEDFHQHFANLLEEYIHENHII